MTPVSPKRGEFPPPETNGRRGLREREKISGVWDSRRSLSRFSPFFQGNFFEADFTILVGDKKLF
jgi:hypothetical protein